MSGSAESCRVLFVDDEESVRYFARRGLERRGFDVAVAESGTAGLSSLDEHGVDVVVTDLRMPGIDGFEFLQRIRARHADLPVIVITAHGSVDNAVQAMREGAQDFLAKPFEIDELALVIRRVRRGGVPHHGPGLSALVGESEAATKLRHVIGELGETDDAVLFHGESGTGKTHAARVLHGCSKRGGEPFQRLELAGHEPGQRSSETSRAIARAAAGTLLVAGLEDLDDAAAADLTRAIAEARCRVVGSSEGDPGDLPEPLRARFDRRVGLLPLRARREDLRPLGEEFLRQTASELGAVCRGFADETIEALSGLSWPGNLRELRNTVQRAVVLHRDVEILLVEHLGELDALRSETVGSGYHEALQAWELEYFSNLFRATRGNVSETARRSGLSRGHLHRKVKQLGLDPARFR